MLNGNHVGANMLGICMKFATKEEIAADYPIKTQKDRRCLIKNMYEHSYPQLIVDDAVSL